MACKYVATIECSEGPACKFCGWNPSVSKRRIQAVRTSRNDEQKLARRLRAFQAEYSKGCFRVLSAKTNGEITEYTFRNISEGHLCGLNRSAINKIDAVLTQFEAEKEVENDHCR